MKNIFSSIKLTFVCIVFFSILYPLVITGIAQFAPNKGKGETIEHHGEIVGFQKIGQSFTSEKYFWGRPSAVNYNPANSGGSNKGNSNPEYLITVEARIDSFLLYHPYLSKHDIPVEMITASGSGLDPDISPKGAYIQAQRIAKVRNIDTAVINNLIKNQLRSPIFGIFGPPKINVLELNIALNKLK